MFELTWLSPQQHRQLGLLPGCYQLVGEGAQRTPGADFKLAGGPVEIAIKDRWIDYPQARLDLQENGQIRLENFGRPILLASGQRINSGQFKTLALPAHMVIGTTRLSLTAARASHEQDATFTELNQNLFSTEASQWPQSAQVAPAMSTLVQWFDSLNQLHLSQVGSQAFFDHAVQCTFDPGGLDLGLLVQRQSSEWQIVASHVPFPEYGFSFRRDLVEHVASTGHLCYHRGYDHEQLVVGPGTQWIVAAPIMDERGQVTAVLYAARFESSFNKRQGIRPLEAHFMRLIADAVSVATRRLAAEAEATRAQVLLEQAFSPPVVNLLKRDPQLLDSRESEVTVLFADLRGFSRLSESLGSALTHRLLADVLNLWTRAVHERQGVVIDYYGDGLAAFWNCPLATDDHSWLACQTAWRILADLETIRQEWSVRLASPLQVGVGINTGVAQVGNSGSRGKLKYGPRGHEVNLASRLEQATKHLGAPILLSHSTAQRVKEKCRLLRLCRTHLPALEQTVEIFQLLEQNPTEAAIRVAQLYSSALQAFEAGNLPACLEILAAANLNEMNDPRIDYLVTQIQDYGRRTGGLSQSIPLPRRQGARPEEVDGARPYQVLKPGDASGLAAVGQL